MSEITYSELMTELDKYKREPNRKYLTTEQRGFIEKAREKGMRWREITVLWNKVKGWEKYRSLNSLCQRYLERVEYRNSKT